MSSAWSGMTLWAEPACTEPTVGTAVSGGGIILLMIVWNSTIARAAITTGSLASCGIDP